MLQAEIAYCDRALDCMVPLRNPPMWSDPIAVEKKGLRLRKDPELLKRTFGLGWGKVPG